MRVNKTGQRPNNYDSVMSALKMLNRRMMRQGCATEKDKRQFLKTISWMCGRSVTLDVCAAAIELLELRQQGDLSKLDQVAALAGFSLSDMTMMVSRASNSPVKV